MVKVWPSLVGGAPEINSGIYWRKKAKDGYN
jgi:hypothetical protein